MPRAVLNGTVLAEAHQTVVVEGNHYFPPDAVSRGHVAFDQPVVVEPTDHDIARPRPLDRLRRASRATG